MTTSMYYFLVVANELSMSKAAEKLYISQQCVSSHIKKLEQQYQTELFTRKPNFKLTDAGEALRRNLYRQKILEESFDRELDELKKKRSRLIRIGLHGTRATLLLPDIIPKFQKIFPDVNIENYQGDTISFEKMLLSGSLDLFLGTDIKMLPEYQYSFLRTEPIYIVATESLLRAHQLSSAIETRALSLHDLSKLPFICSPKTSYLQQKIDKTLSLKGVEIHRQIIVNTYQIKLMLASRDSGATFCPQMALRVVEDINRSLPANNSMIPLIIPDLDLSMELSLITHRDAFKSICLNYFSDLLERSITDILDYYS